MKIIAFDGVSGSGKTTLKQYVQQSLGLAPHDYIFLDRWVASTWVFHKMFGVSRNFEYINDALKTVVPVGIVWCNAPIQACKDRLIAKNDSFHESLNLAYNLFDEYFANVATVPFLKIDTTRNIHWCVEEVRGWMEKL